MADTNPEGNQTQIAEGATPSEQDSGTPPEQSTQTDTSSGSDGAQSPQQEDTLPVILGKEDRAGLDDLKRTRPELAPLVDHVYSKEKNMLSGWTKAMQKVPREFRDGSRISAVVSENASLKKRIAELEKQPRQAETKTSVPQDSPSGDFNIDAYLEQKMPDASEEEREHAKRFAPLWLQLADYKAGERVRPLAESSAKAKEDTELGEVIKEIKTQTGHDLLVDEFKDDIAQVRKENPKLSAKAALRQVLWDAPLVLKDDTGKQITFNGLAELYQSAGKKKAAPNPGGATFVAGGPKSATDSGRKVLTQAEIDNLSAEEYEAYMKLPKKQS